MGHRLVNGTDGHVDGCAFPVPVEMPSCLLYVLYRNGLLVAGDHKGNILLYAISEYLKSKSLLLVMFHLSGFVLLIECVS